MRRLWGPIIILAAASLSAWGQNQNESAFRLEFDPQKDVAQDDKDAAGQPGIFYKVRFTITQIKETDEDVQRVYKIRITEDGHFVKDEEVPRPKLSDDIAAILAVDMSGSMREGGKVKQAKDAGNVFFDKLPQRADCGLIIFDHELRFIQGPIQERAPLRKVLKDAPPGGGTAYLDAAAKAIELLRLSPRRGKAAIIMTDGVDLNSQHDMDRVIQLAGQAGVKIFTIGIGEPGKSDLVTSVLALDKSGSMNLPADDIDKQSKVKKIDALKGAAERFVKSMRPTARTTILDFSDTLSVPEPFSADKEALRANIARLKGEGETAFLDAAYEALRTLETENPPGKKAVVVLTDGVDNSSRHRVDEVINEAKRAGIPLHMLSFGRESEIDSKAMKRMADETGGKYFHAKNEKSLLEIFEKLSIELHDDGIDEVTLRKLASATGGMYFPAKDVSKLRDVLGEVSQKIQAEEREVTFASLVQRADGRRRVIGLDLVRLGEVVQKLEGSAQVRGLIVAETHPFWYLLLLIGLGALLVVPAGVRSVFKGGQA